MFLGLFPHLSSQTSHDTLKYLVWLRADNSVLVIEDIGWNTRNAQSLCCRDLVLDRRDVPAAFHPALHFIRIESDFLGCHAQHLPPTNVLPFAIVQAKDGAVEFLVLAVRASILGCLVREPRVGEPGGEHHFHPRSTRHLLQAFLRARHPRANVSRQLDALRRRVRTQIEGTPLYLCPVLSF